MSDVQYFNFKAMQLCSCQLPVLSLKTSVLGAILGLEGRVLGAVLGLEFLLISLVCANHFQTPLPGFPITLRVLCICEHIRLCIVA